MSQRLFIRIATTLAQRYMCFTLRSDASGRPGLSTYLKCTAAIRQLAYAGPADMFDEYLQLGETTALTTLRQFCNCIQAIFGPEYLRKPNADECQRLIDMHGRVHNFSGMLGGIDCMHWEWRNCPVAWKGQFTSGFKGRHPTMILEAVADYRLRIWVRETPNKAYYLADGIYPRWPMFVKTIRQPVGPKQSYFAAKQKSARKDVERASGVLQA
ncbi:uncharacterized protein LOC125221382 [Salvia hispanica]|uniref:uncharacterized protein LOC125221382 n=1 Tax=Salvia hispanica TaxID=49212 RepID=UPI0020092A7D|nr:uncharacterized protein LOC125221382 [Salvia hispanica]